MTRIHYRNDFMVQLRRTDSEGNIIPIPAHPWHAVLYTAANPLYNKVVAGYCDGTLTNAVIKDDSVIFVLDGHGLQPGRLLVDWHEAIPDDAFPDGACHIHCTYDTGVELVPGMGDAVTKAEVQVQVPYIWQSAYDMAVSHGYEGTMQEYIAAAAQLPTAVETATAVHDSVEELKEASRKVNGNADRLTDSVTEVSNTLESLLADYKEGKFALAEAMTARITETSAQESLQDMAQKIEGYETPLKMCDGMTFREYAGTTIPDNIDTSEMTHYEYMFYNCTSLESIPKLDMDGITEMRYAFYNCKALKEISELDFSKVQYMYCMFQGCTSLTAEALSGFDTSSATSIASLFQGCTALTTIPQIDTSKAINHVSLFQGCTSLVSAPQLDMSSSTQANSMFQGCTSLVSAPQLDMPSSTQANSMFQGCTSLVSAPQLDMPSIQNCTNMFYGCTALTDVPDYDLPQVRNINHMFYDCSSLVNAPKLNAPDTQRMEYMFNGCTSLEYVPDMFSGMWDVRYTYYMFQNCSRLKEIPMIQTGTVSTMQYMFSGCSVLTTVRQIDMSKATNVSGIFYRCTSLVFALIKNVGKSTLTTFDFSGATAWGTGSDENRQSLIDSLITYSHDRAAAGMATATIKLSTATKALLTSEEIAQITAKGFTIA